MLVIGLVVYDIFVALVETVLANSFRAVDTDEDHRIVTSSHLK